ncbi:MAG: hypothetical protein Q4E77_00490 [Conchiformibius sp.]|nr:hypothetical protein [Conchiformibius sp.]
MNKKTLLAGAGVVLAGIGGFALDVVKPAATEAAKKHLPAMLETAVQHAPASAVAVSAASSAADAYREADERCADQVAQNPAVDLNDSVAVSEARIRCLLVTENQGAALDALAETDAELKQLLADIRRQLSQPSTVKE